MRIFASVLFNNQLFEITIAEDTRMADGFLKFESFDIIVCDVMMPGEDGIRFCNRLKKSGNATPFIFLSAVSHPDMVKMGLTAGANAYFVKPFDAKELQNKIVSLVLSSKTARVASGSKNIKKSA
jgi:DNA-binding response OmpR family regulator